METVATDARPSSFSGRLQPFGLRMVIRGRAGVYNITAAVRLIGSFVYIIEPLRAPRAALGPAKELPRAPRAAPGEPRAAQRPIFQI